MLPGPAEELAFCTASTLVEALRRREISSRDLLEVYLERVERLDAPINSVVTLDVDGARAAAAAADEAFARGDGLGPLHGLPMTIKDCWDVAGVRTTVGDPDFANHRPVTDAPLVERLRASGAVMFGRTNV